MSLAERQKDAVDMKYEALYKRLKKENPKLWEELYNFTEKVEELWVKVSPFVGEEEGYGKSGLSIDSDQKLTAYPFDFIWWFALFEMISDKFDQDFKWFRKNKEILDMMVKEYLEAGEHR